MKKITFLVALLISTATFSQITTVASTSFEEPVAGTQYFDTGDASVIHDLINNTGESAVDFTSVGGEIGFDATYQPYDSPDVGLTDGDFVGTTTFTGDIGSYTDGVQGYQLSDTDGNMIVTFDAVDLTAYTNNTISIDYFLNSTGYEGDGTINESGFDRIRIYVRDLTNNIEIDILNTEGSDIDDLNIEGMWITGTTVIPDAITAQLVVEVRTNSAAETLYLDNIKFEGEQTSTIALEITEIFSGQAGTDLTADWFEIKNNGTTAWVQGVDPDLYYDDESAAPGDADIIQGITNILPGESVLVLISGDINDITTFSNVWSPVIDLTGIEIGITDGAGLGAGGDAVTIWLGDPTITSPVDTASYPDTASNDGHSYDVELAAFSVVGNANGAVETLAQGGSSNNVPNIGSPGNGIPPMVATVMFVNSFEAVTEDSGSITIEVSISEAPTTSGTVVVSLRNGGSALEGSNFTFAASETLTFPAGSTDSQFVTIPITNNTNDGSDIFFMVQLENPSGLAIGTDVFTAYILDDDTVVPVEDASILDINFLMSFLVDPSGTAEISAYDPISKRIFVTNATSLEVLDFSDPSAIVSLASIDITPFGSSVQSVAVQNGIVAAAIAAQDPLENGFIVIADTDGNNPITLEVGSLPDMLVFSPDGTKLLSANEGQPSDDYSIDPEGSISVIDVSGGLGNISQANVTTLTFTNFNAQEVALKIAGVRIFGPGASVAQDLEPEYITVSNDSQQAFVTLQENNAYAIVNLATLEITDVIPFGLKDHSLSHNSLDTSDETNFVFNASWPVKGLFMPDAISFYQVGGIDFIVTANEGDARDYSGYAEERKLDDSDYSLDPTVFSNIDVLELETNLGDINVTAASGDIDNDGLYEEIHVFGGRSFSIFEASTGTLVYDSGNDFEVITAAHPTYGEIFNASNDNNNFKNRSDNKGPEPEGVLVKELNGRHYAFIILERIGGVMVYDVTNPFNPFFLQYLNNRGAIPGDPESGDLGPEGIIFVDAVDSPTGSALLMISNEVSATLSVYSLDAVVLGVHDYTVSGTTNYSVYPNPVNDVLFFSKIGNYEIFDVLGRKIDEVLESNSIQTAGWQSGTYIVKNTQGISKKIIVK